MTFLQDDSHFRDWASKHMPMGGFYAGIDRINKEKPDLCLQPSTRVRLFDIKRLDSPKKTARHLWKAEYVVAGKIVGGVRREYEGHCWFNVVVDCGFLTQTRVSLVSWGPLPGRELEFDPGPSDPLDKDFKVAFGYGDYVEFNAVLKGVYYDPMRHYENGSFFMARSCGKVAHVEAISSSHGAFVTLTDVREVKLEIDRSNIGYVTEDQFLSEDHPDFDIEMPPS